MSEKVYILMDENESEPKANPRKKKTPKRAADNDPDKFKGFSLWKQALFWVLLFAIALIVSQQLQSHRTPIAELDYSEFLKHMQNGNIKEVTFIETKVEGEFNEPILPPLSENTQIKEKIKKFRTQIPFEDTELVKQLHEKDVIIQVKSEAMNWASILLAALPWVVFIGLWIFFIRQIQGGNKAFTFGKSKARLFNSDFPKLTFKDVAGAEEAKQELVEIIEFLKEPEKFTKLGGKIPKGALLLGPPGTGKTLLAKAVAGEANVPFFSMSGSDFVEMFVGVGASRVRDLFEQGKKHAPCIIFIDEIDAVGRHRGAGLGGGHDEREQTLNQLLVEMDGFNSNEGIILIAATNRPDVLDPALLRPGRFDRQVVVDRPTLSGREGILAVHTRNIPLAKDVDLKLIARFSPGFSGADLANLVNEAALLAARNNRPKVIMLDFESAKDKVLMGTERRSLVISDEQRRITAYHEAGHALIAKLLPHADPIHKMTIIPRGRALGLVSQIPIDDRHTYSKNYCEDRLAVAMGGRAAEEMIFNQLTSGASNDIEQATHIARKMVCDWGMSAKIGPLHFGTREEHVFLGREFSQPREFSESTTEEIDAEVRRIVEGAYMRAKKLLERHKNKLILLSERLLEKEILDSTEIDDIIGVEFVEQCREEERQFSQKITPSNGTPYGYQQSDPQKGQNDASKVQDSTVMSSTS